MFKHYVLTIELCKVPQNIFSDLFTQTSTSYTLRSKANFVIPQARTVLKE